MTWNCVHGFWSLDFAPMIRSIVQRLSDGDTTGEIALGFHEAVSRAICEFTDRQGRQVVILSGGVFQNALLLEKVYQGLQQMGVRVLRNRALPPNDACISLGQAFAASQKVRPCV